MPQPKPPKRAAKSVKNSRTSPQIIKRRALINEALEYRRVGHSYTKIAEVMKVPRATVYDYVRAGLADQINPELIEEVRQHELDRCDELQAAIYPQAEQGDLAAQAGVRMWMDQRAKYIPGLQAPSRTSVTDAYGNPVPVIGVATPTIVQLHFGDDVAPPVLVEKPVEPTIN